jgi:predicted XRE-type DNA-binding protein
MASSCRLPRSATATHGISRPRMAKKIKTAGTTDSYPIPASRRNRFWGYDRIVGSSPINAEMMKEADDAITRGTGNIFADLGYADAEERQTKLRLAHTINGVIARRRLSQAAAAEKLGINQPKVSALANYKLDGFSAERLMTFLTALAQDVEVVIKAKPRSRAARRISVVVA